MQRTNFETAMYIPDFLRRFGSLADISLRPYERNHQPVKHTNTNDKDIFKKQLLQAVRGDWLFFRHALIASRTMFVMLSSGQQSNSGNTRNGRGYVGSIVDNLILAKLILAPAEVQRQPRLLHLLPVSPLPVEHRGALATSQCRALCDSIRQSGYHGAGAVVSVESWSASTEGKGPCSWCTAPCSFHKGFILTTTEFRLVLSWRLHGGISLQCISSFRMSSMSSTLCGPDMHTVVDCNAYV